MRRIALSVSLAAALQTSALAEVETFRTEKGPVVLETVAKGLEHPWALAFLPDGRMLVTERPGRMRIVDATGTVSAPLSGVPAVAVRNQGGLLDVALDPDFAANRHVYVTFAEPREGGNGTSVARMVLNAEATGFANATVIFRQEPTYNGGHHFGSRIVFDRTGALFVALGDRYNLKDQAQNRANTVGKVVRIRADGSIPPDNPGHRREGWHAAVWSMGHRNIQGAALHPATGKLWTAEHGARGGDEINIPEAGRNYGWPVITYGRDYSGAKIGEGAQKAGMEQPVFYWDPSIAPSGMAFYTGDRLPGWKGNVLIGGLAGGIVARMTLEGDRVVAEERLFAGSGNRFRDVRQGPDGLVYLLTDHRDGRLLRIRPGN
ncbi:MAG: PQQ-dependent sugar dehydrogenase [Beijerinckiaceae bacterium]